MIDHFLSSCPLKAPNLTTSTSSDSESTRRSSPVSWNLGMAKSRTRGPEVVSMMSVISASVALSFSGESPSTTAVLNRGWFPAKKMCGQDWRTNGSCDWKGYDPIDRLNTAVDGHTKRRVHGVLLEKQGLDWKQTYITYPGL